MARLDSALFPASNSAVVFAVARAHGMDCSALAAATGIDLAASVGEGSWHTAHQRFELLRLVGQQAGLEALGYELGLNTPPTLHGTYGLGLLSSATIAQALEIGARYFQLRNPSCELHWCTEDHLARVELIDLMPQAPMRQASMEWTILSIVNIFHGLLAGQRASCHEGMTGMTALTLHLPWDRPTYHDRYASRLPTCLFNARYAGLCFPRDLLTRPLAGHAPANLKLMARHCERDLAQLSQRGSHALRVGSLLMPDPISGRYPSREDVADRLHLSVSALKRHLASEGTTFSALHDEARCRDAKSLLTSPRMTVEDVGARLGFSDTASFAKAFRKWCGDTPTAWRRRVMGNGLPPRSSRAKATGS